MKVPVYMSEYFPNLRILIKTPSGILEKCTTSPATYGETYSDSYDFGLGKKSLQEHNEDFKNPEVLEGVSFMGKVYLPAELVKDAIFYEKMHRIGRVTDEERNEVFESLFLTVGSSLPTGARKNEATTKLQ